MEHPRKKTIHFSLLIFLVSLLFSFLLWDRYLNSGFAFDRVITSYLILGMGTLFSIAAGLFAWSLETRQAYLEQEVKRKYDELVEKENQHKMSDAASVAICWLSQILLTNQKLESLFDSIIDLVKKVLQADDASIMLLDSKEELYIAASSGIPQEEAQRVRVKLGERVCGRAAQTRKEYLLIGSLKRYPDFQDMEPNLSIGSSVICPLVWGEQVLGVLTLNRAVGRPDFTELHLRHALVFSSQIAQVLWNAIFEEAVSNWHLHRDSVSRKFRKPNLS